MPVNSVTTLPTWAYWLTAFGAPIAGVFGVLYGHRVTRRGLIDADRWRRREETMRMLRWSAESVGSGDERMSRIGVASLIGLIESEMLQNEDLAYIEAVARAAVEEVPDPGEEYAGNDPSGEDAPGTGEVAP